jgi:hypothetical protein
VHDLRHDGRLYRSKAAFLASTERINRYLKEWNAVGFRSGFMLRELNWLHHLNIQYDGSTFDTDPFEPQPEGVNTIFPFWVPSPFPLQPAQSVLVGKDHQVVDLELRPRVDARPPLVLNNQAEPHDANGRGYVELPYTLPQDSTLFLLLKEKSNAIWKRKLDWIADHGGMALVNVHPDYLSFGSQSPRVNEYSVELYEGFLRWVKQTYKETYWPALPSEVAQLICQRRDEARLRSG